MRVPRARTGRALALCLTMILALGVPVPASAHTAEEPFATDLIAGGGNPRSAKDVGDVLVWNDGDTLYVRYALADGCGRLSETHLEVATSLEDIPQRNGNPPPGRFTWSMPTGMASEQTYAIPLGDWGPGAEVLIAAHASVVRGSSRCCRSETAWGAGEDFPGRNWAMYFRYTVQGTEQPTASLGDFVWDDLDRDGVQDEGEPGKDDATVQLLDESMNLLAETVTGESGFYQFSGLMAGTCYVRVSPPDGYLFSPLHQGGDPAKDSDVDSTGLTGPIALAPGEEDDTIDAGLILVATGSIGDFVWEDDNGNGIQDSGEPGKGGVTVTLLDYAMFPIASTTTDGNGSYSFGQLMKGTYYVEVTPLVGYGFSLQYQGGDPAKDSDVSTLGLSGPITLEDGEADMTIDAGLLGPPS